MPGNNHKPAARIDVSGSGSGSCSAACGCGTVRLPTLGKLEALPIFIFPALVDEVPELNSSEPPLEVAYRELTPLDVVVEMPAADEVLVVDEVGEVLVVDEVPTADEVLVVDEAPVDEVIVAEDTLVVEEVPCIVAEPEIEGVPAVKLAGSSMIGKVKLTHFT